jgi:hypothetical protein
LTYPRLENSVLGEAFLSKFKEISSIYKAYCVGHKEALSIYEEKRKKGSFASFLEVVLPSDNSLSFHFQLQLPFALLSLIFFNRREQKIPNYADYHYLIFLSNPSNVFVNIHCYWRYTNKLDSCNCYF